MEDYKKRYEEALSQAEKELKCCGSLDCDAARQIFRLFPELKESEDEKIRKQLLNWFKDCKWDAIDNETLKRDDIIAWLEKQGEQKPVDKVEPKFKVGDWIINSEGMLRHILAVDKTGYQTDYGWLTHDIYDNTYHLWTIQDARKGDILQANKCTLIFDSLTKDIDDNIVISSWYYCDTKTFYGMGISQSDLWIIEGVVPATKEQRDLLFQKMKEAGYEWDTEKKELKKIEQEDTELPKGEDYAIDGLWQAIQILEHSLGEVDGWQSDDGILEHKCAIEAVKRLYKQKPAWSEEDEKILQTLINDTEKTLFAIKQEERPDIMSGLSEIYIERLRWLKSLKERYTWKPSDEQMDALNIFIDEAKSYDTAAGYEEARILASLYEQLKKLKGE